MLIWKNVPNFEETHEICQYGIIRKKDSKREIKFQATQVLWDKTDKKHKNVHTNSLLSMLFDNPYYIEFDSQIPAKKGDDLDYGFIAGEKWRVSRNTHKKYAISNFGRVYSYKTKKLLKPTIVGYQWIYHLHIKKQEKSYSIRTLLKKHYNLSEIRYDMAIPPEKALVDKLKSGKIGVYRSNCEIKKWRYVIQKDGKHHAAYFKTKDDAIVGWAQKYCELNNVDFTKVFGVIL